MGRMPDHMSRYQAVAHIPYTGCQGPKELPAPYRALVVRFGMIAMAPWVRKSLGPHQVMRSLSSFPTPGLAVFGHMRPHRSRAAGGPPPENEVQLY